MKFTLQCGIVDQKRFGLTGGKTPGKLRGTKAL
jgi:hypothetical protein